MTNGRCGVHGGLTPVGLAHPSTKHGFFSKYLPRGLAQNFKASLDDPDIYKLTNEIALVDARISDLIMNLKEEHEILDGDPDDEKPMLDHKRISAIWNEIGAFTEQRRKLVESERKRMVESHQVITGERMMYIVEFILKIIIEVVKDKKQIATISRKLGSLLNRESANQIT